jgi:3-(3-hydroxy-phenyl)propionate hydroxylase
MPRYTTGCVVRIPADSTLDDIIGRMFMQPTVETSDRRVAKLDDVIGPWFAVIGVHADPASSLDPADLAWWRSISARFIQVVPPRSGPLPRDRARPPVTSEHKGPDAALIVEDIDGAFRDWRLAHHNAEFIVLRPDRYVAAIADRTHWGAITSEMQKLLG